MVPQGEDAQSNSPIVESSGSSSPDLVSGDKRIVRAVQLPRFHVKEEKNRVHPNTDDEEAEEANQVASHRMSSNETARFLCYASWVCVFLPARQTSSSHLPHLSVPGRDLISLAQWRKSSLPDDDQANSKPGFRRLRLSRAATKPLGRSRGRLEVGTKPQDAQRATQPMRRLHLESYSRGSAPSVVAEGRDQTSERMGGWDWFYPYCVETERASLQYSNSKS